MQKRAMGALGKYDEVVNELDQFEEEIKDF